MQHLFYHRRHHSTKKTVTQVSRMRGPYSCGCYLGRPNSRAASRRIPNNPYFPDLLLFCFPQMPLFSQRDDFYNLQLLGFPYAFISASWRTCVYLRPNTSLYSGNNRNNTGVRRPSAVSFDTSQPHSSQHMHHLNCDLVITPDCF